MWTVKASGGTEAYNGLLIRINQLLHPLLPARLHPRWLQYWNTKLASNLKQRKITIQSGLILLYNDNNYMKNHLQSVWFTCTAIGSSLPYIWYCPPDQQRDVLPDRNISIGKDYAAKIKQQVCTCAVTHCIILCGWYQMHHLCNKSNVTPEIFVALGSCAYTYSNHLAWHPEIYGCSHCFVGNVLV